jgi:hypothetical protein
MLRRHPDTIPVHLINSQRADQAFRSTRGLVRFLLHSLCVLMRGVSLGVTPRESFNEDNMVTVVRVWLSFSRDSPLIQHYFAEGN